jgi:hypothetical protein
VLAVLGLSPSAYPPPRRIPPAGAGDAALHLSTIERLRQGEGYYDAVGSELRRLHYPATRVFNWRTPAHFKAVALLSVPVARAVLGALALIALALTPVALKREPIHVMVAGTAAQFGAIGGGLIPAAVGVAEVWAGVLIALSVCAYYQSHWTTAAILGVCAVFMRELAAPYAVVCALLALAAGRRRESCIWIIGGLAYAVYFWIHATEVWAHQLPGDLDQREGWLRWNGLAFILATVKVNGVLAARPHALTVFYTICAIAGALTFRAPRFVAWPVMTYFLLYSFAGQPFNYYWGYTTTPIWAFAAAHGLAVLPTLVTSARLPGLPSVRTADAPIGGGR